MDVMDAPLPRLPYSLGIRPAFQSLHTGSRMSLDPNVRAVHYPSLTRSRSASPKHFIVCKPSRTPIATMILIVRDDAFTTCYMSGHPKPATTRV